MDNSNANGNNDDHKTTIRKEKRKSSQNEASPPWSGSRDRFRPARPDRPSTAQPEHSSGTRTRVRFAASC